MRSLILTVTRRCNLRCSYCPTVKDGWPSLSVDDALEAIALFTERYGGGDIKLFGGEPLLVPESPRLLAPGATPGRGARARPEARIGGRPQSTQPRTSRITDQRGSRRLVASPRIQWTNIPSIVPSFFLSSTQEVMNASKS